MEGDERKAKNLEQETLRGLCDKNQFAKNVLMRDLFRSSIWRFKLDDLAIQVGGWLVRLVPHQPCFGALRRAAD